MYLHDFGASGSASEFTFSCGPEEDLALFFGKQGVVFAATNIFARQDFSASLAHQNLAGLYLLTSIALYS